MEDKAELKSDERKISSFQTYELLGLRTSNTFTQDIWRIKADDQ